MVYIAGKSLGEKQRNLNVQVLAVNLANENFNNVISEKETCDLDKLFKIDLASKRRNVDYIIEVLKCGDSLYVTRALKSIWIYDDVYSDIINPNNLNENIFPFMSFKMKKKFLTTISMYLKSEERAAAFYNYCMKSNLINIAAKFLIITTNDFKMEMIENKKTPFHDHRFEGSEKNIEHLIGSSFELASAYLNSFDQHERPKILNYLRYLYSVSSVDYLDMLEKYDFVNVYNKYRFGLRISKSIMQNHKDRVLKNVLIYVNRLNNNTLVKYSDEDNAKSYLKDLLPDESMTFWSNNYCAAYEFILNLISLEKRFEFVKSLFTEKYNEEFETTNYFYNLNCYKLMTPAQQNVWASYQVENHKELLGPNNEYLWYKFIDFKTAFKEIKKFVIITPDTFRRANMVNILIESAKNQDDLKALFIYFYDRHVNELRNNKEIFMSKVIEKHNIFEFDEECWTAFDKIMYSMNIYNLTANQYGDNLLITTSLIYHIIKKKELHVVLKKYLDNNLVWYTISRYLDYLYKKLSDEQKENVYQFLLEWYTEKVKTLFSEADNKELQDIVKTLSREADYKEVQEIIQTLSQEADNKEVRRQLINCVELVLDILHYHKKAKEQCPDVVMQIANIYWYNFKRHSIFYKKEKSTNDMLIYHLKKDAKVAAEKIMEVKNEIIRANYNFNINQFLRKIKVYFSNDLVKDYLNLFIDILKSNETAYSRIVNIATYGLFQLADETFLNEWMLKYTPTESKIDHSKIDTHLLDIQRGICRFACFTRPFVPLSSISKYIKGDYIHFCLPMFNYYAANLPLPLCLKFIESLIDAPVSIHKHGIRLAFLCFSIENLKKLITDLWNKTKNVSVKTIIYKALFDKIANGDENEQTELFPLLISCTIDLNENDQDDIYDFLTSNRLSQKLLSEYIECTWHTVNKLSFDKSTNIQRKANIIDNINNNISLLRGDFVKSVIEKYINDVIVQGAMKTTYPNTLNGFYMNIWGLTVSYIIFFVDEYSNQNVEISRLIVKKCIEFWNTVDDNIYIYRHFCWHFITMIIEKHYNEKSYENAIPVLEVIAETLRESLSTFDTYLLLWDIQLATIQKKIGQAGKIEFNSKDNNDDKMSVIKSTVLNFGNEVGSLIKSSVHNQTYFSSFANDIKDKIVCVVQNLKSSVDVNYELDINRSDLFVLVCVGLMQYNIIDIHFLALDILPTDKSIYWNDELEDVISKIKASDNLELKTRFYQKFIYSDYQRREFISNEPYLKKKEHYCKK